MKIIYTSEKLNDSCHKKLLGELKSWKEDFIEIQFRGVLLSIICVEIVAIFQISQIRAALSNALQAPLSILQLCNEDQLFV